METIYISFLWHMHQPFYKNLWTGEYLLPWVLLHGTKDYFDMPYMIKDYEKIKQNFNLVPSLLLQLRDYEAGEVDDIYLKILKKPAEELTSDDKYFILMNFFNANWENMIKPFPRFYELLRKRGFYYSKEHIGYIQRYFSVQDFRDIQILFFLSWIDPLFFSMYEELQRLKAKGRFFTEEDKERLIKIQHEILKGIIPIYKELAEKDKIELSTSPFYHPIIPLLIDNRIARVALPDLNLPEKPFSYPEDAIAQIEKALAYFHDIFGFLPEGMWPPEGSVSNDALKIYMKNNINWVVTDEDILFKSLNIEERKIGDSALSSYEYLCKPYIFESDGKKIHMIFREKMLSDLISFHYSRMHPKDAAEDLIKRILLIRGQVKNKIRRPILNITMDGENAWENYTNDGWDFFKFLYDMIEKEERIRPVTISEYLKEADNFGHIFNCFAGSWINHNFYIWIGHIEDNTAWSLLTETREVLEREDPEKKNKNAWESIYIAEGSDWNWWYGDDHASENDEIFDLLFRENLSNVYRFLEKEPPAKLSIPVIIEEREVKPQKEPVNFIKPIIDGKSTNYFEWMGSGYLENKSHGVSIHESINLIKGFYFGFDERFFYLRADLDKIYLNNEKDITFDIQITACDRTFNISYSIKDNLVNADIPVTIAYGDILEAALEVASLGVNAKDKIFLWLTLKIREMRVDRIPSRGYLSITVPSKDFEMEMWYV